MLERKQKLGAKLKNTPVDASQVHCSVSSGLNKLERVSVQSKVLTHNNLDGNHSQHRGSSGLRVQDIVYVLNMRGQSLMPTKQQKANKLLKQGKAKIVKRNPFTIQLKYATGETKQNITLGIDSGYSFIGFSALSEKKELISGEVSLRKDVSKKLTERKMYRNNRRNKLWYRKPRFLNRTSTKKKGWLAPSIEHKLNTHIRLVEKIKKLLPVTETVVEVASFDTQKMQNPEISGIEYQQGELQGYEIREYLLEKWGRKCVYCGKSNIPLEIEHIIPKSRGGSGRVSNLTLSCHKCNQKKGDKTAEEFGYPKIQKNAKESLKATAFMNLVRWKIVEFLNCKWTYGYITKHNRIKLNISKSHSNDAFVIANGTIQERGSPYGVTQIRRNNRHLQINRKGFKLSIRKQRYKLQPHNLVYYKDSIFRVKCVHCLGKRVVLENKKSVKIEEVKLCNYMSGWQFLSSLKEDA